MKFELTNIAIGAADAGFTARLEIAIRPSGKGPILPTHYLLRS